MKSIKTVLLSFCKLTFYPDYVISEINDGVDLNTENITQAHETIVDFFGKGKFYGYISLRVNDYNVNPTDYLTCSFYEFMNGMAVVTENNTKHNMAKFEKSFFKKPLEVFYTLEEAIEWINMLPTSNQNKKADL